MLDAPAISLRNITNSFGGHVVHRGLDLDVRKGEILGVIGASGSGKSVLLRTIVGLRRQQAGEVSVLGVNLTRAPASAWEEARRHWGVLFQDGALFSSLTVKENVQAQFRRVVRLPGEALDELAALKISLVGLPPEAGNKLPAELSGGMRKRAGLARALALDPDILLLDEPTAGLDPIGAADFDLLIRTLSKSLGLTVFLVTHDIDTLYAVCDRVAVLEDKRISNVGRIEELLRVDDAWIREYFLGPRGRAAGNARGGLSAAPCPENGSSLALRGG
ncbi:MAG: ATP-binding cassette domain-containing protein [Deltaproteobacteria bacterium]|jgi:phospholipid/cholesterol/gamma-HCH transport system ATP-binding protein|nr:ATP-binding cassette domain-containing protein [Deltaproteobacteria bacterium]